MKKIIIMIICLLILGIIIYFTFFRNVNIEDNSMADDNLDIEKGDENMSEISNKITININGVDFTATLEDNETARELVNRLPLNIEMNELNGNEKYYYFDESFPSNSSRIERIEKGDIMLYGSDCLVLFYESFNTSYSYTRIGKLDNPSLLDDVIGKDSVRVTITE